MVLGIPVTPHRLSLDLALGMTVMADSDSILDCQRHAESSLCSRSMQWELLSLFRHFQALYHTLTLPRASTLLVLHCVELLLFLWACSFLLANWLCGGCGEGWGSGREDRDKKAVRPLQHPLSVAGTLNHKGPSSLQLAFPVWVINIRLEPGGGRWGARPTYCRKIAN